MNKKLAGILICIGLLITALPVTGIIEYDTGYYWNMMQGNTKNLSIKQPNLPITGGRNNSPPFKPTVPDPANGSIDIDTLVVCTWHGGDPDGDPVTYDVYFGTTNPPPKIVANQSSTSYDPGALAHITTYYWQIIAWDNQSASNASDIWQFTTRANSPPIADAGGPYSGYTGDPITLDGSASTDPDGIIVLYEWDFETDGVYDWNSTTTGITTHTYTSENIFTATLRVTDDDGVNDTANALVNVTLPPNYPPYVPSNPNPANQSINIDFNQDLSWTGGDPNVGDIVTYDVYFGNVTTQPIIINNHSETTLDVGTMEYNETYYWYIVAWDNNGLSTIGPLWSFTVESKTNHPPFIPSQPDPANGALDVSLNQILSWVGGDPDGNNVTYDIYFGTNTTPAMVSNNQSETFYDPGYLTSVTTYYWYIIAWDNQSLSSTGPLWNFTTLQNLPPLAPHTPSPVNGSTGVNINVDIMWNCSDPNNDALTYDIYFGITSPPPKIVSNHTSNVYDPGTLFIDTTYYWSIIAWDPYGESAAGPQWQFSTQPNTPPNKPIIVAGPHDVGPTIRVNYSAIASDPENDQIFYRWDWGDDNITDWYGPFNFGETHIANYTWYFQGNYQIRCQARDINGAEGPWSDAYNVSIAPQIHLLNLDPGFVYLNVFVFNRSYAYIHAFYSIGLTAMISTTGMELRATASNAVKTAEFETYDPLFDERIVSEDTNLSNGITAYHYLSTGIWRVTVKAFDTEGTMIDADEATLLFIGGGGGSGTIGQPTSLRQRIANRLLG